MTVETTEYKRETNGRFTQGTPPGPGFVRGGGSRGKTWKRSDGGATLGKHWKTGKPAHNRKEPVVRVCHYPGCEVVISTPPSLARIKGCSKAHYRVPQAGQVYSSDWPAIREAAWQRDGFRCLACGGDNPRLECHHLDYDKLNNEMENLATLCSRCHQGGHRRNVWPADLKQATRVAKGRGGVFASFRAAPMPIG